MTAMIERTGARFGRLTVIGRAEGRHLGQVLWLCICDCGNQKTTTGKNLQAGRVRSCGCLYSQPKREVVGYSAAHYRIRAALGKAAEHPCTDCSAPASDWSYDHTDPDELVSDHPQSAGSRYSLKPEHYAPRCKSCHKAFDLDREVAHV